MEWLQKSCSMTIKKTILLRGKIMGDTHNFLSIKNTIGTYLKTMGLAWVMHGSLCSIVFSARVEIIPKGILFNSYLLLTLLGVGRNQHMSWIEGTGTNSVFKRFFDPTKIKGRCTVWHVSKDPVMVQFPWTATRRDS